MKILQNPRVFWMAEDFKERWEDGHIDASIRHQKTIQIIDANVAKDWTLVHSAERQSAWLIAKK